MYVTVGKLYVETKQHFELPSGSMNAFPTFENVAEFLEGRVQRISSLLIIMGDLPEATKAHMFTHAGVDYARLFHIRCSKGTGQRTHKGYVALLVCLTV